MNFWKIAFAGLILIATVAATPEGLLSDIKGNVIDAETDEALSGVEVKLEGTEQSDTTNQEGEFVIEDLNAGAYTVRVEEDEYEQWIMTVDVLESGSVSFEVKLEPAEEEKTTR